MKVPETLYKYTTASTAKIVLESGCLRWSNTSQFNDLHEFQIMPVFSPNLEQDWEPYLLTIVDMAYNNYSPEVKALSLETQVLLSLLKQLKSTVQSKQELFNIIHMKCPSGNNAMEEHLRSYIKSIKTEYARVLCLTSSPTNHVMWAHYASNHTGCVLGFRSEESSGKCFLEAEPVKYTEGSPVIGTGKDFLLYGESPELRQKTVEAIFYTKQKSWAYENEWRVITWRNNETNKSFGDYIFYREELESITFGPRLSNADKVSISNVLQDKYYSTKIFAIVNRNGKSERMLVNG